MSTDVIRNYQNDPNVQVEALVNCKNFNGNVYIRCFRCSGCCNEDLCVALRAQEQRKKEEQKATQVVCDESDFTLDRARMYITSSEPTPSPISYRVSDYLRTYYGTAVGADSSD